jgi:hypothetical protein
MSPEQIRGDAHLMDGRSDIYSLGAVLYELLAGRPLFRAADFTEYYELILRREPRPLRSLDDTIPEELDKICLKCLAKDIRDRYATAQDLARDLNAWSSRKGQVHSGSAWLRGAVALSLALSLVAGAAVLFQRIAPLSGGQANAPSVTPLEQIAATAPKSPATPGAPVVKELVWPQGTTLSQWEVLPTTQQLKVYCDSVSLLQLGATEAEDWELSATLEQVTGTGRVGLFLGYRKDPQGGTASFELIRLMVLGDKEYLNRRIEKHQSDATFDPLVGDTLASARLETHRRQNTLRLVVRGNRLREVYFNGVAIPELADVATSPPTSGAYGVFNRQSDVVVSELLFNGRAIPLLDSTLPRELP